MPTRTRRRTPKRTRGRRMEDTKAWGRTRTFLCIVKISSSTRGQRLGGKTRNAPTASRMPGWTTTGVVLRRRHTSDKATQRKRPSIRDETTRVLTTLD